MKIRNGFVSNSSSSSFVIYGEINPAQFIIDIIPYLESNRKADWGEEENLYDNQLTNAKKILESKTPEENVVFTGTINFETYVVYQGESLLISTCNNERWEHIFQSLNYDYYYDNDQDDVYDVVRNNFFVDLEDMEMVTRKNKDNKIIESLNNKVLHS